MNAGRKKLRVLFLCTGNSCRSQMAEGWARALRGDTIEPFSAGTVAKGLDPRAVRVMAEAGADVGGQRSKTLAELRTAGPTRFDLVVTLCGAAHRACPVLPGGTKVVHRSFDDPPQLAQGAATEEAALAHYRRVRDEIRAFVEELPDAADREPGRS